MTRSSLSQIAKDINVNSLPNGVSKYLAHRMAEVNSRYLAQEFLDHTREWSGPVALGIRAELKAWLRSGGNHVR